MTDDLRFPAEKFNNPHEPDEDRIAGIEQIAETPSLTALVPSRPGH